MFENWKRKLQKPLVAFIPFTASTQDIAFVKLLKDVQGMDSLSQQLLVVHSFRGCRKTRVAERCSIRSRFFIWQPYVKYWDLSEKNTDELSSFINTEFSFKSRAMDAAVAFVRSVVICVFLGVAWYAFGWYNSGRKLCELSYQEIKDAIVDEFPTKAGCTLFGGSIVFLLFRRKPIVVLDDAVSAPVRTAGKVPVGRHALDCISIIGKHNKALLISSNDGIAQCFADDANLKRTFASFPPATPQELVYALNDVPSTSQYDISLPIVQSAADQQMIHHAFSVRWWDNMHTSRGLANVIEGKPPPRHSLWDVVLQLDCKCSETFRAQCLGLSLAVSDSDCEKLAKLTGTKPPENCPRRLALAWCMVESATMDEFEAINKLRDTLLEADDKNDRRTHRIYQIHLAPLVQLIERKFPVLPVFWVRSDENSSSAFAVTPSRTTIDSLKDAIKAKAPSTVKCDAFQISILDPDTKESVEKQSTPLKANSEENPYLFKLPTK